MMSYEVMTKPQDIRHWSGGSAMNKTSIRLMLYSEGLDPYTWQGGAGDIYHLQAVPYYRTLWVARGSLVLNLPQDKQKFILRQGDRLAQGAASVAGRAGVDPGRVDRIRAQRVVPGAR